MVTVRDFAKAHPEAPKVPKGEEKEAFGVLVGGVEEVSRGELPEGLSKSDAAKFVGSAAKYLDQLLGMVVSGEVAWNDDLQGRLIDLVMAVLEGIVNYCYDALEVLMAVFNREKSARFANARLADVRQKVLECDLWVILQAKCVEDPRFESFDACFAISEDCETYLEAFNQLVSESDPDKVNGKLLKRVFAMACESLKRRKEMEEASLIVYLDFALKALNASMLNTQVFGVDLIRELEKTNAFRKWARERNPLKEILQSSAHDEVFHDLDSVVVSIAKNSEISADTLLEITFWLVDKATSSEKTVKLRLVASMLKLLKDDEMIRFVDGFLERDLTEAGIRFLGACIGISSFPLERVLQRLVNLLDSENLNKTVNAVLLEIVSARKAVSKDLFIYLLDFMKRSPLKMVLSLLQVLVTKATAQQLLQFLERLVEQNVPEEWYCKVLVSVINAMKKPLTMKIVDLLMTLVGKDPVRGFTVIENCASVAGNGFCYVNSFGEIISRGLSFDESIPLPAIRAITNILTKVYPYGCSTPEISRFFASYVKQVLLLFGNIFGRYAGGAYDDLLFENFMRLYRVAGDETKDKIIEHLCLSMKTPVGQIDHRLVRFFARFGREYEALIPDDWIGLTRQRAYERGDVFPVDVLIDGSVVTLFVSPQEEMWDFVNCLSVKLSIVSFYLDIYVNSRTVPFYGKVGDVIVAKDTIRVEVAGRYQRKAIYPSTFIASHPELHLELFQCLSDTDKDLWKLLVSLPTLHHVLMSIQTDELAVEFLGNCQSNYQRRYVYQAIRPILASSPQSYPGFYAYVVERLRHGEINTDILQVMMSAEGLANVQRDMEIVRILAKDGFIRIKKQELRQFILQLFIRVLSDARDVEDLFLELDEFLKGVCFNGPSNALEFLQKFSCKPQLFGKLVEFFDEALNLRNSAADGYFSALNGIVDSKCDTQSIVNKISHMDISKQSVSLLKLFRTCLAVSSNVPVDAMGIIGMLVEDAISGVGANRQAILYDLMLTLCSSCPQGPAVIHEKLERVKSFVTDRWNYEPSGEEMKTNGYRGLRNLGSTCYMNSILQQLFFNKDFRNTVITSTSNHNIVKPLRYLFLRMALAESSKVDTIHFGEAWGKGGGIVFNPREQEDAVEFMQRLLERLPSDITQSYKGISTTVFEGIDTDFRREIQEPFYCLEIPVSKKATFNEAMATLKDVTLFVENNQYHDEERGKLDVKRYSVIDKLPKVLVIQLKRFDYNIRTGHRIKIQDNFDFPNVFNASSYFDGQSGRYQLCGVVTHSGNADGGHYVSLVWCTNQWIKFDDDFTEPISEAAFGNAVHGHEDRASTAYLLFYVYRGKEKSLGTVTVAGSSQSSDSTGSVPKHAPVMRTSSVPLDETKDTGWEQIAEDVKALISQEDANLISQENKSRRFMRSLFTTETARFILEIGDWELIWNYFLRVLCHSTMDKLCTLYVSKLVKEAPEVSQFDPLQDVLDVAVRVVLSARDAFFGHFLGVIEHVCKHSSSESLHSFMKSLCENTISNVTQWHVIGKVGQCLRMCFDGESVTADVLAPTVSEIILLFYKSGPSEKGLTNVDFTAYLMILTAATKLPDLIKDELFGCVRQLMKSETKCEVVYKFVEGHFPERVSEVPAPRDKLIELLERAQSEQEIVELWKQENFPEALAASYSTCRSVLMKYCNVTLFQLLTRPAEDERSLGEALILNCFPKWPKVDLPRVESYIDYSSPVALPNVPEVVPYDDATGETASLLTSAVGYLSDNFDAMSQRLMPLIRMITQMRCILGVRDMNVFGDLVIRANSRNLPVDNDLTQMLVLLTGVDFEQVVDLVVSNYDECMALLRTDINDFARRTVYCVNAFKMDAALAILMDSENFTAVVDKLISSSCNWAIRLLTDICGTEHAALAKAIQTDSLPQLNDYTKGYKCLSEVQSAAQAQRVLESALINGFHVSLGTRISQLSTQYLGVVRVDELLPHVQEIAMTYCTGAKEYCLLLIDFALLSQDFMCSLIGEVCTLFLSDLGLAEMVNSGNRWILMWGLASRHVTNETEKITLCSRLMQVVTKLPANDMNDLKILKKIADTMNVTPSARSLICSEGGLTLFRHVMSSKTILDGLSSFGYAWLPYIPSADVITAFEEHVRPDLYGYEYDFGRAALLLIVFAESRFEDMLSIFQTKPLTRGMLVGVLQMFPDRRELIYQISRFCVSH